MVYDNFLLFHLDIRYMSIKEKLKLMLATNALAELATYEEPVTWKAMSDDERELLGLLFVKQGEHQLQQGDSRMRESFELASKIAPNSAIIFLQQALAYAEQSQNIRCLKAAESALQTALQLNPDLVDAWHAWGNVLVKIGIFYEDALYFQQADEKFAQAESLMKQQAVNASAAFYWHWGVCWYYLGKHSGEAVDFARALEKCRIAEEKGWDGGEFHNDYANILVDLACLVGKEEMLLEAVDRYEKAVGYAGTNYEIWLNLACTYHRLYDFSGASDYFYRADTCFEQASEMCADDVSVWLHWAELYADAGKMMRNLDRLKESFEKFRKAEAVEPTHPYVLLRWCEAQIFAASFSEDLQMLREAEYKLATVLKALPHDSEAWYVYGLCLSECGRYFSASNYYFQAIEMFQEGLKFRDDDPTLLHGIALAYYAISEINNDVEIIEKSIAYFNQVADLGRRLSSHFLSDWGVALMKLGEMTSERSHIEEAAAKFETAIQSRLNHWDDEDIQLEWLYNYGCAMDFLGDFHNDPGYYEKSIQVLAHVLDRDPHYIHARYNLALALSHLGELQDDVESLKQAIDHFHALVMHDSEDGVTWNDYALAFLHLGILTEDPGAPLRASSYFNMAEIRFEQAMTLGCLPAYYNLACLYAITRNSSAAMHYLERAEQSKALPPLDDLIHDEWLDNIRDEPAFRLFVSRLMNRQDEKPG